MLLKQQERETMLRINEQTSWLESLEITVELVSPHATAAQRRSMQRVFETGKVSKATAKLIVKLASKQRLGTWEAYPVCKSALKALSS